MKRERALRFAGLAAVAVAVALSPMAVADDSGWYAGFNAGQAKAKIDDARIASGLAGSGFNTTSIGNDDRHIGFKLFGGYEFNHYLALEGGYFDLGRFGFTANTLPVGTLHGETKLKGLNFDLLGAVPIGDKFSVFARAGLIYAEAKDSFAGTGSVAVLDPTPHTRKSNYKFGLGAEYDFTASLGMRVEAERYRIDDAVGNKGDIDLLSAGLVFRFGGEPPPPPARTAAPAPAVAPVYVPPPVAPPPPPPPPPAPAPPTRKKVSFSADSLFDFAKDSVKPAGKQALDGFAAELRGAQFDVITVTGYTDRIGSRDYNMKLSSRRAEAVKAYLVETAGLPAGKIAARGLGAADPVTKPDECKGQQRTPKLIACLQPDRRVEVEVTGTR
jgi:OOP family OmpA-OmpF porin